MWTYSLPPPPEELYHYGVKGMKWGQRKSIAKLARERVYLDASKATSESGIRKLDSTISKRKLAGQDVSKQTALKKRLEKNIQTINKTLEKNYSSLSKKDIAQGRRRLVGSAFMGSFLAGPVGTAVALVPASLRAKKKLKENS